jgi:hypothetical protein
MGWKQINGRQYYYKSERVEGQVKSTYYGAGEVASLVARLASIEREQREVKRSDERAERERAEAEERAVAEWFDAIQAVADAAMFAAGFHKHKGQWRRRRDGGDKRDGGSQAPREDELG